MAHQFYFNNYILDNLIPPDKGYDVVQDIADSRLRLYVTSRGVKTFFVRKRVKGKDKRIIIGNYPDVQIDEARLRVLQVLEDISKKKIYKKHVRFDRVLAGYIKEKVHCNSESKRKLTNAVNRHFSSLFDKEIDLISKQDILCVLEAVGAPVMTIRLQALIKSIFKYAEDSGFIKDNPIKDLPVQKAKSRENILNKTRFKRLLRCIRKEKNQDIKNVFLMLVYGFAKKSKVFSMQWKDLDFNRFMWNDSPLSDRAVVLLQSLPQNSKWVFPGRRNSCIKDPRMAWKKIVEESEMPNLTMDDVHKFLNKQVVWSHDKDVYRENMNLVLDDLLA